MHNNPWSLSHEELSNAYNVDIKRGLTQAEVQARRQIHGRNEIPRELQFKPLLIFVRQLLQPLTMLLLVAAIASFVIGDAADATAILCAVVVSVLAGLAQEGKTARVFDQVSLAHMHESIVVRDGQRSKVSAAELVPGDIVILGGGDAVPADIRLFAASELAVNESILTGEWMPTQRTSRPLKLETSPLERTNIAWSGTIVAGGSGEGVVIATGTQTQFGKIAQTARASSNAQTPLEVNVRTLAFKIALAAGAAALLISILGILRGESIATILLIAIAVGVSVIPEGLPVAVTVVLAGAMERILAKGGLVKSLRAAETLGATTIIMTDKTGTLTEGRMAIAGYTDAIKIDEERSRTHVSDIREVLTPALLASEAFFDVHAEKPVAIGRPVEQAILYASADAGLTHESLEQAGNKRLDFVKFDSSRRYAISLNAHPDGKARLYFSGAPEILFNGAHKADTGTTNRTLDTAMRKAFEAFQHTESSSGKRLIGVAYAETSAHEIDADLRAGKLPENLVFSGMLSLDDPVRLDAPDMVAAARAAGVRVIMATGDFAETARSIAERAGIITAKEHVVTGQDMEKMSDEEFYQALTHHSVFARVLPEQKLRMANLLRAHGEVVAMTGDGVNDAPALAAADIGVAVGTGAAAAKDAADLVLLNNNFGVITAAIAEGRRAFANLRKTIMYLLSSGFSEIIVVGGALAAGGPLPILPAQILWANIIEEGIMAFPFAREPLSPDALKKPSRTVDERALVPRSSIWLIVCASLIVGALLLALYVYLVRSGMPHDMMRSVMFIAMSLDPIFLLFSLKEPNKRIWHTSFIQNPFLLISMGISIAVLFAAFKIPFLADMLSLTSVPLFYVGLIVAGGIVSVALIEVAKWILCRTRN